ncbi:MAG TPA: diaminopimelate decarboxylase [Actinomycetota bacterium]|nr:diaminopimelate decarboxylase [Actinomycetota bacterium]
MQRVLPDTAAVESTGRLQIAGCDVLELAETFGTPLVVLDRASVETRAKAFASVVEAERVYYAAKAFCCVAMCELLEPIGLGLDVCTRGELETALTAGFPAERILFHGNNKSVAELERARESSVGRIVADSLDELGRLKDVGYGGRLLLRVTPGVEAHTHEFVQTGQEDSKFGFAIGPVALEALAKAMDLPSVSVAGIHAHIGSQIFELAAYDLAIERLADFLVAARDELGFVARELNLGGGFGIAHTRDELTPDPAESVRRLLQAVEREFPLRTLPVPAIAIEPGRAIVGQAALTLYRVGTVKHVPGGNTFVAVDGGMGDNIRPPLYGAKYEALLANRADAAADMRADIVGRFCESGDFLIKGAHLPGDVRPGDLLAIPATGAYTYSMASNYNRQPRPAVVMVADGNATQIIAREAYEDVLRLDRRLDGSAIR